MGDARCLDHAHRLQPQTRADSFEEPRAAAQEDGDDMELQLVDQPRYRNWLIVWAPPPTSTSFSHEQLRARLLQG